MFIRLSQLLPLAAASLAACGDDPTPGADAAPVDPGPASRARFRDTFETQNYGALPAALADLAAADAEYPGDPDTVLLVGLANLWGISEVGRDPAQVAEIPARATGALGAFLAARQLRPDDARVFGWLGATQLGIGTMTENADMIAQGRASVAAGVEAYPQFNLFVHALVTQRFPRTTPEFASAIDAYYVTLDLCFHTTIDRDNPDATPFAHLATSTGVERVCWDTPYALHSFEGYFLHMGDALVKAGEVGAARRAYQNASVLPDYATWPYRGVLEQRLVDLDARAALYADADPANDPPLIGEGAQQCASCHARQ